MQDGNEQVALQQMKEELDSYIGELIQIVSN